MERLEKGIRLEAMTLGDLLERSDESLGATPEPEILTCTERGGIILQKERFAKRVATNDVSKYKVVGRGTPTCFGRAQSTNAISLTSALLLQPTRYCGYGQGATNHLLDS